MRPATSGRARRTGARGSRPSALVATCKNLRPPAAAGRSPPRKTQPRRATPKRTVPASCAEPRTTRRSRAAVPKDFRLPQVPSARSLREVFLSWADRRCVDSVAGADRKSQNAATRFRRRADRRSRRDRRLPKQPAAAARGSCRQSRFACARRRQRPPRTARRAARMPVPINRQRGCESASPSTHLTRRFA